MADTGAIKQATNSASMRGAIASVLTAAWKDSRAAQTLNGYSAKDLVSQKIFNRDCKVDSVPTYGSSNMVSSGGIFAVLGDLENINGGY